MEKRIKNMYNDAAKAFNEYLTNHDIEGFTNNAVALVEKYGHCSDIHNLMIWWSARVKGLHDEYMRSKHEKRG